MIRNVEYFSGQDERACVSRCFKNNKLRHTMSKKVVIGRI